VRRQDFSFDLPEELIAQSPLPERSASRLLVLDGATGGITDRGMGDLPSYLRAGDLLIFNDTRVVAARIVGSKPSGGRVEIFLERVTADTGRQALVQLRASKPIREGLEITTPGGIVRVVGREDELWRVEVPGPGDALEFFEAWGEVPLPPYIHRLADASDRERYQSIFAREKGAVAAPTASLHFDAPLVAKLEGMGVGRAFVTLHVGAGTFQPLRTDDLDAHKMHAERVSVSAATWDAIRRTREAGGRVIAVGTTVVRALESAALSTGGDLRDTPPPTWSSETRLFVRPGFEFRLVDAMVTNFHLPESTLLMLVSAFAGREHVLAAYAHAVRERYRFFSYGDAMLVMPTRPRLSPIRPTPIEQSTEHPSEQTQDARANPHAQSQGHGSVPS
jgi:S-adenosylmethionine:tRNA ribosyltransferase-isomerase